MGIASVTTAHVQMPIATAVKMVKFNVEILLLVDIFSVISQ